jgi:hypothetical protein
MHHLAEAVKAGLDKVAIVEDTVTTGAKETRQPSRLPSDVLVSRAATPSRECPNIVDHPVARDAGIPALRSPPNRSHMRREPSNRATMPQAADYEQPVTSEEEGERAAFAEARRPRAAHTRLLGGRLPNVVTADGCKRGRRRAGVLRSSTAAVGDRGRGRRPDCGSRSSCQRRCERGHVTRLQHASHRTLQGQPAAAVSHAGRGRRRRCAPTLPRPRRGRA